MTDSSARFVIDDHRAHTMLRPLLGRLPEFRGEPIRVRFRPALTAHRGQLLSGAEIGMPVHAGTHLRKREMVLETDLLARRSELIRIFVHETYHFVWAKLGNPARNVFEQLVHVEMEMGARGELGWPAMQLKQDLNGLDLERRTRKWRNYLCESFCDTAAWMHSHRQSHDEWTLPERWRRKRATRMRQIFEGRSPLV